MPNGDHAADYGSSSEESPSLPPPGLVAKAKTSAPEVESSSSYEEVSEEEAPPDLRRPKTPPTPDLASSPSEDLGVQLRLFPSEAGALDPPTLRQLLARPRPVRRMSTGVVAFVGVGSSKTQVPEHSTNSGM